MSIPLTPIDLTGSVMGQTGKISLNSVGVSAGGPPAHPSVTIQPAQLLIYNESGFGLRLSFGNSSNGIYCPAGAWFALPLPLGENELDYSIVYGLASAAVNQLLITYFASGEKISVASLGNSPIGGSLSVSSGQTFFLATPFQIFNNTSLTNGTTTNVTCTGIGGIPTGATAILLSVYFIGQAGTFGTFTPQGVTWSQANYPLIGLIVNTGNTLSGNLTVPLNTTNGQITVGAQGGNISGMFGQIYGYIF